MNKLWVKVLIVAAIVSSFVVVGRVSYTSAYKSGLQDLIQMCFYIPGMYINNDTGKVIMCQPLAEIPKEELQGNKT